MSLISKSENILFGSTSNQNPCFHIPASIFSHFCPRLYLTMLHFCMLCRLLNSSRLTVYVRQLGSYPFRKQYWSVCWRSRGLKRRPVMTPSHRSLAALPPARRLLRTSKWQKVMLGWRLPLRYWDMAPSSVPFIRYTPLLPPSLLARFFADVLHLSCWVTFMEPSQV